MGTLTGGWVFQVSAVELLLFSSGKRGRDKQPSRRSTTRAYDPARPARPSLHGFGGSSGRGVGGRRGRPTCPTSGIDVGFNHCLRVGGLRVCGCPTCPPRAAGTRGNQAVPCLLPGHMMVIPGSGGGAAATRWGPPSLPSPPCLSSPP